MTVANNARHRDRRCLSREVESVDYNFRRTIRAAVRQGRLQIRRRHPWCGDASPQLGQLGFQAGRFDRYTSVEIRSFETIMRAVSSLWRQIDGSVADAKLIEIDGKRTRTRTRGSRCSRGQRLHHVPVTVTRALEINRGCDGGYFDLRVIP